jgi:DNA repair protein SbcD/Mre11
MNSSTVKFAHLADLHLGSWRDPSMRKLSTEVFVKAIDDAIEKNVDFILFAGDIFNTSLPGVDTLKIVTKKLKELYDLGVPLYVISGSHDFSPSGKTMVDVLENAGLLKNVCKGQVNDETKLLELKFTIDEKTKTKIVGIVGRRGLLDKTYYENLERKKLEDENGIKIFMFHTTLTELKPKHLEMIDSQPASFLPKNFNYYAGGHIHHKTLINIEGYGPMTYPGALFPTNFSELEKYSFGGYYFVTIEDDRIKGDESPYLIDENLQSKDSEKQHIETRETERETENSKKQQIEWVPIKIKGHRSIIINCNNKNPSKIEEELLLFAKEDIKDKLITIRLFGTLESGKISDINFQEINKEYYDKGAFMIMKNTTKLVSKEYQEIKITTNKEVMEEEIIKEHLGQMSTFDIETEKELISSLLHTLNSKKNDGEKVFDFTDRINQDIKLILEKTDK